MQQGGNPSPFDRNLGTKMGVKVYNWLVEQLSSEKSLPSLDKNTACVLGLRNRVYQFQPVEDLKAETDFPYRRWKRRWWVQIRTVMKILVSSTIFTSSSSNKNFKRFFSPKAKHAGPKSTYGIEGELIDGIGIDDDVL